MKKTIIALTLAIAGTASAMSPGLYTNQLPDGSTDVLVVHHDGFMSIELTRQVGGPGGLTNAGVVPYPTVCRVMQFGKLVREGKSSFDYQVTYVKLISKETEQPNENCPLYTAIFNAHAKNTQVVFSVIKSEFKQIK